MIKSLLTFLIICFSSLLTARNPYNCAVSGSSPIYNNCTERRPELIFAGVLLAPPRPPRVGTITQPGCAVATGSVVLSELPRKGTWILTRIPGGVKTTDHGTSVTITGLLPGTYYFTVTDATGTSEPSAAITINSQPVLPAMPLQSIDCSRGSGKAVISVVSPLGTGLEYKLDGGAYQSAPGFTGIANGSHFISVRNSSGCITTGKNFSISCNAVSIVAAPVIKTITQPTCILSTGSVVLSGLPAEGTWILTRYPGTIISSGAGIETTVTGLMPDTYNYTVTNSRGSVSPVSANVVINPQPLVPTAPVIGAISQPSCNISTGSVSLTGLLAGTSWTLTRSPDGVITTGTTISTTISGLKSGIYNFVLTNSSGCASVSSASVSIYPQPTILPKVIVTNPAPVCAPATVNLNDATLTTGSTKGLTYTYWTNPEATIPYLTPATAGSGIYYINGTTTSGCSDIKPIIVTINIRPVANAGPDQVLESLFVTEMAAEDPGPDIRGSWSVIAGDGDFFDSTYARTSVTNLSTGKNIFLWTVKNGVCPPSLDSVSVTVRDLVIPTLITPNNDGKNDYFIIGGKKLPFKTELIIFDRRGVKVFINNNYDNKWNGVDSYGKPLPDDTYFFVVKSGNGKAINGYVVLRR